MSGKNNDTKDNVILAAVLMSLSIGLLLGMVISPKERGMDQLAAQQLKFGINNAAETYKQAQIGAACINAGHEWVRNACQYKEK